MTDLDRAGEGREAAELLAIELAFGLLEPAEAEAAAVRVRDEPSFAALYQMWQARALALLDGGEETPPDHVWSGIVRRLPANDATRTLRWWQAATAAAASVALALGATLALRQEPPPTAPIERPPEGRPLVAVLTSPDREDVVAISYYSGLRRVSVLPRVLHTEGRAAELWVIPEDGQPVPAGLVQSGRRTELVPAQQAAMLIRPGATFAISLEPPGGSRSGLPTGPVILTGTIVRS